MATIIFFADHNEEALRASFKLARQLKDEHNNVLYVGVSDSERCVAESGLTFFPIYESAIANLGQGENLIDARKHERRAALLKLILSEYELDILMDHAKPALLFLPSYLALEGELVALQYPGLVSFLRSGPRAEPRLASVTMSCAEVLDDPIFGPAVENYLSARVSGGVDLQAVARKICQLPEYIMGRNAALEYPFCCDESGLPFDDEVKLTEIFLRRHPSDEGTRQRGDQDAVADLPM